MFRLPKEIWQYMEPLVPKKIGVTPKGTASLNTKKSCGWAYVLRTGCQWKAVPQEFGSGSSLHRYFQEWEAAGVFAKLWEKGLVEYDKKKKIKWKWQSIDTCVKSPLSNGSWEAGYEAFHNHRCRRSSFVIGTGIGKQA